MKKFINVSPYQKTSPAVYKVSNNPDLAYEASAFPILNVLNAYADKDEEVEIVTVVTDYEESKESYERIKEAIGHLADKKGFKYKLKAITIPYSDDIDTNLELFEKLIDVTADGDTLYADMSFGSKVQTLIINMALNYGYRIHNDVAYGCIAYGKYDHKAPENSTIYDITSLSYMDEIVRVLAESGIKNPKEHIKRMLR